MSLSTNAHSMSMVKFEVLESFPRSIVHCIILDMPVPDILSALEFTSVEREI